MRIDLYLSISFNSIVSPLSPAILQIYILHLLPQGDHWSDPVQNKWKEPLQRTNTLLQNQYSNQKNDWIALINSIESLLLDEKGDINDEYINLDYLSLTENGYSILVQELSGVLEPYLDK